VIAYSFYLAAIAMIIFVVQFAINGFTEQFVLVSDEVTARPWTLLTSVFLHGSLQHLLSNLFALVFFGLILESIVGSKRFIAIFLLTGLLAGIASIFLYNATLGASGAIFGIIGVLAAIRPRMAVYALGIPMPMFVAAIVWALFDLAGLFYPSDIANLAHLAGLVSGVVIGFVIKDGFREAKRIKEKILTKKELDEWDEKYMGK